MRFSARLRASNGPRALILEDAPRPTRIGYIKGVLTEFVGVHGSGYAQKSEPLDAHETHEAFVALIRDESDPWDYDNQSSWAALSAHVKECHWQEFYDFIELVGKLLQQRDDDSEPFDETAFFKTYQAKVNALFQEDGIGWELTDKSELHRQTPTSLAKLLKATEPQLTDKYANARVHYQKAKSYLHQHPIDEANSIKEVIGALESVCKVHFPKASTLGDAIKVMRKDRKYSEHLLAALERLYTYSNATPLVRHGHARPGCPSLPEAELSLYIGVAFIRYLIEVSASGS